MITKGMVDEKLSSQVIFLDEKRRKRRGWGDRDGDTPLAVLKERSSKEDRYQFTQLYQDIHDVEQHNNTAARPKIVET
ncbi:uncharacterized [Tachysurus ichikawai]